MALRRLVAVSRGDTEHFQMQAAWPCAWRKHELIFGCGPDPGAACCWGSCVRFFLSLRVPSGTKSPTLKQELIRPAECSPRKLQSLNRVEVATAASRGIVPLSLS